MGSAERRQRETADTRRRILDAARDLFVQKGYRATSMRAIAERIEYTPTAIYHHFESKGALLTELCAQDFRALAAAFQRVARVDDPVDRLLRIGDAYVDFGLEHPMHYQLMFMMVRPAAEKLALGQGDPVEDAYAFLRTTVEEAVANGRFRPEYDDPDQIAQMLWATAHGLVSLRIAKMDDPWIEFRDLRRTAAQAFQTMMRGLLR
jgi:AcrR family transcriptional regulator